MNNKKLLGKRIKEIRKSKNLTQERLAELIGIETSSLSGIESGRHFPSLPTIEKIAQQLDIEIKDLFEFKHLQPVEDMKNNIINSLDNLNETQIAFLHRFFE